MWKSSLLFKEKYILYQANNLIVRKIKNAKFLECYFIWTGTCRDFFKSALVYLESYSLCVFLKKESQLQKNKLISCILSKTQKVIQMLQNHNKKIGWKSRLVKTKLDYIIMFYYRVVNCKFNRWETLPSPSFFETSEKRRGELLDSHPISPE